MPDKNGIQTKDENKNHYEGTTSEKDTTHDSDDGGAGDGDDIVHGHADYGVADTATRVDGKIVNDNDLTEATDDSSQNSGDNKRGVGDG